MGYEMTDEFDALLSIAAKLLGPNGCPWDQKQTFLSLQPYVLEEAHEVVEAVDADDDRKMIEELGDLFYTIVFYAKLGEKSGRFSMDEIIKTVKEKLIRRHPHVFGEVKVEGVGDIIKNWEKIKAEEKGEKTTQASIFDGIPPTLPLLIKVQKILRRIHRLRSTFLDKEMADASEAEIGDQLLRLILRSELSGIDAESALRRSLAQIEEKFRKE
jgi:MazG family protein